MVQINISQDPGGRKRGAMRFADFKRVMGLSGFRGPLVRHGVAVAKYRDLSTSASLRETWLATFQIFE
jgi:hypothetical protein